ncbi:MAG: hypothetical protein WBA57_16870 [Elainellaceae cyanobacterium]
MDWVQQAKQLFNLPKPEHFNNYRHCCECAEHDETLCHYDVDSIGLEQLGYPSWDPLCGVTPEGLKYYFPAMVRLTLESIDHPDFFYGDQLLFHLIWDGNQNRCFLACTPEQRAFITRFVEYLINTHAEAFDYGMSADQLLQAHDIWSEAI